MQEQKNVSMEHQKNVAYYTALVNAWIQTKIEHDKTLISLSAGGIGLLVAILSAVGVKHSWEILLYFAALFSFIATTTLCIYIFDRNSKHIEDVLNKKGSQDYMLKRLDKLSFIFFVLAVLFSMAIGIVTAFDKLSEGNVKGDVGMRHEKKIDNATQSRPLDERSLDGISDLDPTKSEKSPKQDEQGESSTKKDSDKQSD
jgi:hypothetical protein